MNWYGKDGSGNDLEKFLAISKIGGGNEMPATDATAVFRAFNLYVVFIACKFNPSDC